MNFAEVMDFSRENRFQERLFQRIKAECFAEISDDDLAFVNAAGVTDPAVPGDLSVIRTEDFNGN